MSVHSGGLLLKNEVVQCPTRLVCANPLKNVSITVFFKCMPTRLLFFKNKCEECHAKYEKPCD